MRVYNGIKQHMLVAERNSMKASIIVSLICFYSIAVSYKKLYIFHRYSFAGVSECHPRKESAHDFSSNTKVYIMSFECHSHHQLSHPLRMKNVHFNMLSHLF